MKFRLIAAQRGRFPVRIMCDVMGVSPAGYYAWHGRPESPRKAANRVLLAAGTVRPGSTRPCAPGDIWRAVAASHASCVITVSKQ
jgi:hypothetical protein